MQRTLTSAYLGQPCRGCRRQQSKQDACAQRAGRPPWPSGRFPPSLPAGTPSTGTCRNNMGQEESCFPVAPVAPVASMAPGNTAPLSAVTPQVSCPDHFPFPFRLCFAFLRLLSEVPILYLPMGR